MKATPLWENAALVVAILLLWPKFILGRTEAMWSALSYATLAVLLVICVRRVRRLRALVDAKKRKRQS